MQAFGDSESEKNEARVPCFHTAPPLSPNHSPRQPAHPMAGAASTLVAAGEEPPERTQASLPMRRSAWATSPLGGNFRSPDVEAAFWEYMMPM